jgi:hypothetical protein
MRDTNPVENNLFKNGAAGKAGEIREYQKARSNTLKEFVEGP